MAHRIAAEVKRLNTKPKKDSRPNGRQTLAELLGDGRLLVERHKGILQYGNEEILVGTTYGALRVCGEGLRLCCMSREQLFVAGTIRSVRAERWE